MREAFKGIELDPDSNDVDLIRMQLEKNRRTKKVQTSSSNKAFDFVSSERQNRLHWTIQPCNTPTNSLYICEKSTSQYSLMDKLKEKKDHYGNDEKIDEGITFVLIILFFVGLI